MRSPLYLLCPTSRHAKDTIDWTPDNVFKFQQLQDAILNMPKLYFIDDTATVKLYTDASNFGIGAYLLQIKEGKEVPIGFMSRKLKGAQLRWPTIEKELYAVAYALKHFEYLLRPIHFDLYTDHRNLTYEPSDKESKIYNWLLRIQKFDFTIYHVAGSDNTVAYSFSRLCEDTSSPRRKEITHMLAQLCNDQTSFLVHEEQVTNENATAPPFSLCNLSLHQSFLHEEDDPYEEKEKIIAEYHNGFDGHLGIQKTMDKLKEMGHKWLYMYNHVVKYVHSCPTCQKNNINPTNLHGAHFTCNASRPMEMIAVDTITGLPTSSKGYNSIICVIDTFTRYVRLYPTMDTTSTTAAKVLVDFMCDFGVPESILSDNGSQYVNETITQLLATIGIERRLSLAYSHQENAIVERANREVIRHIKDIVTDARIKFEWHRAVPLAQRIINNTVHSATGFKPHKLVFGDRIDLDRHILANNPPNEVDLPLNEWVSSMQQIHTAGLDIASASQVVYNSHKERHTPATVEPSDLVLVHPEQTLAKRKLDPRLQGPYRVEEQQGTAVELQSLVGRRRFKTQVSNLVMYDSSRRNMPPELVAQADDNSYTVEAVRGHTPKKGRTDPTFWIKWQDYPEKDNTWEPFKNVNDCAVVHEYMRARGMEHLIPKQFV